MMQKKYNRPIPFLCMACLFYLFSCNSPFTPKPKGYFKIDLPEHQYQRFDQPGFPFSFEYPAYAIVSKEVDSSGNNPYWINVEFKDFNGKIYLSYKSISGRSVYKIKEGNGYRDSIVLNSFDNLREEAFRMTYKHTVKASGIVDSFFTAPAGSGVYFYVAGEAATSKQFYISDSSRHFLRGALYFDAAPNEDSLSVVSNFIEADMRHLLKTLQWK